MEKTKPFTIPEHLFRQAYRSVKKNAGAAGVDKQSLEDFERDLDNNLYKLWNRMSSGTYFPPAVKAVPIPKKSGGERILGVPTVADRVAQTVVKLVFEPCVERHFLPDSYGYRPGKSALDAIGVTRQRCWQYDWVVEFDIRGLFDNIDHELLMKAVRKHTDTKWVTLYIERWLTTPMQTADGRLQEKTCGVMQGGVISPVLSNLFLHYVFDVWMKRNHPEMPWCRYADDGLVHCRTEEEAKQVLAELAKRFEECKLELHPDKTKIIYCKDANRKGEYPNKSFDFLGYTYRARGCRNIKNNTVFTGFSPAVSKQSMKAIRAAIRKSNVRNRTELSLEDIARWYNPTLQGWLNYYGAYNRSSLYLVWEHFERVIVAWAMRKHKPLRGCKGKARRFLDRVSKVCPKLFAHWKAGMVRHA